MDYEYIAYPKVLYGPDGETVTVASESDHAALNADEWHESPWEGVEPGGMIAIPPRKRGRPPKVKDDASISV